MVSDWIVSMLKKPSTSELCKTAMGLLLTQVCFFKIDIRKIEVHFIK